MTTPEFDQKLLSRLADVAVNVGLGLQAEQDLIITAPIEALPLVRLVSQEAYKTGARTVTPIFSDPQIVLNRFDFASDQSLDYAPNWLYEGMAQAFSGGAARMAITGEDPMLLAGKDPSKVARVNKSNSIAYKPALEPITNFDTNWTICAYPTRKWARRVFGDVEEQEAVTKLANAIFSASRINSEDPVSEWQNHNMHLHKRTNWLNQKRFAALRFSSPVTNLTVGLARDHEWKGGCSPTRSGLLCNPNIPTEEVFTTPDSRNVNGYVASTKPLSHHGSIIDGIKIEFRDGLITNASAKVGESALHKLLETDDGARRLGEVALVPHNSPISQANILFYNTLFDENAASHIALGQCYSDCFLNGHELSAEQIEERGGNTSMVHVDWMIGSSEMNVDGIERDGTNCPVFRAGDWCFDT